MVCPCAAHYHDRCRRVEEGYDLFPTAHSFSCPQLENAREGRKLMLEHGNSMGSLPMATTGHGHSVPSTYEEEAAALREGLLLSMADAGAFNTFALNLSVPSLPIVQYEPKRQLEGLGVSEANILNDGSVIYPSLSLDTFVSFASF